MSSAEASSHLQPQPHTTGGQWKGEGGLRLTCLDLSLSLSKVLSLCCKSLSRGHSPRVRTCFSSFIFKTLANLFQMRTLLCFLFLYYTLLQFVNTGYRCYLRPHTQKKSPSRSLNIYLKFCIRSHVSSSRRSCKVKQSPLACSV